MYQMRGKLFLFKIFRLSKENDTKVRLFTFEMLYFLKKKSNNHQIFFLGIGYVLILVITHQMLDSLEGNTENVHKAIQNLYEKVLIFRFKLNDSNLTEGRQGYLVKRTYIPDDNLERKINNIDATNVSLILLHHMSFNISYYVLFINIFIVNNS
jgi:hypothetical protein